MALMSTYKEFEYIDASSSNGTIAYHETSDDYVTTDDEEFSPEEIEETQDSIVERLSSFADKVTRDLRHYIRFNANGEDHCDVYEDKFATTISGRDLYYADLLAMARYGDYADSSQATNKRRDKRTECKWPCSGRRNPKLGLGPLSELFDHLYKAPSMLRHHRGVNEEPHCSEILSFNERNFPTSDFSYPYLECNLANQLDLSEILEKWPLETSHHGESYAFHNNFIAGH